MKRIITLVSLFCLISAAAMARHNHMNQDNMDMQMSMSSVNDILQSLEGTWTGNGTMVNMQSHASMNWTEQLTTQSALDNKFVMTETTSAPMQNGTPLRGKGFLGYDAAHDRYSMFWFNSMGFGGEFTGKKEGNTLNLIHPEGHGRSMVLTLTLVNPNQYQMVIKDGTQGNMTQMMDVTYTRVMATPMNTMNQQPLQIQQNHEPPAQQVPGSY